jgi:CxxC motif-containing protein (DUF1111 family)
MGKAMRLRLAWLASAVLSAASICAANFGSMAIGDAPIVSIDLGGSTTRTIDGPKAFTFPAANLKKENQRAFFFGNRLFNTNWVIAPASVKSFDGLGPLFNRVSCSGCHTQDGRGRPPLAENEVMESMLMRLSVPDGNGGTMAHPVYGDQLSEQANPGIPAEGITKISLQIIKGAFGDGETFELQKPGYQIEQLGYGPLGDDVLLSPRVAQQVIGLGLLEAVPENSLAEIADPDDKNGDGISGRMNRLLDPLSGQEVAGRFGWKANQPNLMTQNAGAAFGDIGLTSPLHLIENCTAGQKTCLSAPVAPEVDLSQNFLDRLTLYTRLLAVPTQRNPEDVTVRKGGQLFTAYGCTQCHTPVMRTDGNAALPELKDQTFHPFTDLLLHDMGEGLADNRPDGQATGTEWRTQPLWGVGLIKTVNGHQRLLHDGRARGVAEAVLWHGGEAERAREAFRTAKSEDRRALIAFVNSL